MEIVNHLRIAGGKVHHGFRVLIEAEEPTKDDFGNVKTNTYNIVTYEPDDIFKEHGVLINGNSVSDGFKLYPEPITYFFPYARVIFIEITIWHG